MRLPPNIALAALAASLCPTGACLTTPLPMPPTVDAERVSIVDAAGAVRVEGLPGAVDPGGTRVRVTRVGEPIDSVPPEWAETVVGEDGSFGVVVAGFVFDRFFFEAVGEDEDLFLVALTAGSFGPGDTVEADPGPDRDGDGSPDAVDCAPDDPTRSGRRCF